MGRINRRIYATRRKRSPNKLRFANPGSMSSEQINQMGQMQASGNLFDPSTGISGAVNSVKYMVDNAKPPYLGDEEEIGEGKRYTITKIDEEAV